MEPNVLLEYPHYRLKHGGNDSDDTGYDRGGAQNSASLLRRYRDQDAKQTANDGEEGEQHSQNGSGFEAQYRRHDRNDRGHAESFVSGR